MSVARPSSDLGGEREIDLRRWLDAVLARRWLVVVGLVVGLVVGGLYSLSGASAYTATVTIQPAQPFSPTGGAVLNYTSSPLAIQEIVTSPAALATVAGKVGMAVSQLKGHVTTTSINTGAGPVATRGTVLIQITVTLPQRVRAQQAATVYGTYIKNATESTYVKTSLATYKTLAALYARRLVSVNLLISSYQKTLETTKFADPVDELEVATLENDAIERQGNLLTEQTTNTQEYTLAQNIEVAQVITPAHATKVTSRSRKDSVIFGGLIGLIIGILVALALGLRPRRPTPAH